MTMESLPLEVLRDIFLLAALETGWFSTQESESTHGSIITPLRISHVCQTWRNLSISDGRMWSYLYIDGLSFVGKRRQSMREIFDTWIARSDKAPLNYGVEFDLKRQSAGTELAVHVVTTLIKNRHRWGDVDFLWLWDYDGYPSDAQEFDMTRMPMLTSLDLYYKRQGHITINFDRSSQLRKVDIYGDFSISASEQSLRHLKEPSILTFRGTYRPEDAIRSCQNFLSIAPFLEEIRLEFQDGLSLPTSPLSEDRPIHHGLRRLNLSYWLGSEVLIDNVTLPSLQSLRFRCNSPDGPEKLLHFMERSLPPLTYLEVEGLKALEYAFIPCLRLLPGLEQLLVGNMTVSTRFFHELTVPDNGSGDIVCPALEALNFAMLGHSGNLNACVEAFISMLESRARIMATFRNVWFDALDRGSTIEPSRLREYNEKTKEQLFRRLTVNKTRSPFSRA